MNATKLPSIKVERSETAFLITGAALACWLLFYFNLQTLGGLLAGLLLGGASETHLYNAVAFFLYEVPKVLLLLSLIVLVMTVARSFFSAERTRALLAERANSKTGHVLAALLGTVTPFCSCSAVSLFIGFLTAGIPLGVTFSFLIAAPMVNEVALGMLLISFGWKVALVYLVTGLLIAIVAGYVIGRLHMEQYVEEWVYATDALDGGAEMELQWVDRLKLGWNAVKEIVGKVWLFIVLGIAVGAGIHGFVPQAFMAAILGKEWWAVPLAVLIGIPMYSNAAGTIPIMQVLIEKGAALGTVLAFVMSVIALSLPELVILRRVLKLRLILLFVSVVGTGILLVGYLFNLIFD
ncbi:MAG: permease [Acidobacteria bacterium]|nr:permease [Acidobacteriota bacterium]MBI3427171.1 permease [Acidobacteriota bacterium]